MSEEIAPISIEPAPDPVKPVQDISIPKARFDEVNERMQKAEAELQKRAAAEKRAAEQDAAKRGEWERLATDAQTERDTARATAETAAGRVAALEDAMELQITQLKKSLPDDMRDLIPDGDVLTRYSWLVKATQAAAKMSTQPAIRTTPRGPTGTGQTPRTDTDFDQLVAQKRARVGGI